MKTSSVIWKKKQQTSKSSTYQAGQHLSSHEHSNSSQPCMTSICKAPSSALNMRPLREPDYRQRLFQGGTGQGGGQGRRAQQTSYVSRDAGVCCLARPIAHRRAKWLHGNADKKIKQGMTDSWRQPRVSHSTAPRDQNGPFRSTITSCSSHLCNALFGCETHKYAKYAAHRTVGAKKPFVQSILHPT